VHGFDFTQFGVRVPAVIISPLIPRGRVDHTLYDHSSVLKTLEELFDLPALTDRDGKANSLVRLLSLNSPRTDCPSVLTSPAPLLHAAKRRLTAAERAAIDLQPVPDRKSVV
jgi:phospholipase C